jgi:hypothetical protein
MIDFTPIFNALCDSRTVPLEVDATDHDIDTVEFSLGIETFRNSFPPIDDRFTNSEYNRLPLETGMNVSASTSARPPRDLFDFRR